MTKKYADYMDDISPNILYDKLLSYGFFSEKIPPILDSVTFANLCKTANPGFRKTNYDYIRYETMRNINIPRQLGIPTPMAYEELCSVLRDNWDKIQAHFHQQTDNQNHIISRNHIQLRSSANALFEMNYDDWRNGGSPKDDLPIGMRFVVKADISTCFPSIYTHSIPWALVTKPVAKANQKTKFWFNKIDVACQNTKSKETHGLIIGPHTSNIISEIILTVIDHNLYDKGWRYVRNIDDYTCFVESRDKADAFITDLINELNEFDLSLNHKKTKIAELPETAIEYWVRKLNGFSLLTSYGQVDYKQARAYFDLAIELMGTNGGNASSLNYVIKVLSGQKLTRNAKEYSWKTSMQLSLIYPYLLPLMEKFVFTPMETPSESIEKYSNKVYMYGLEKRNYEACCYAIYYALKYGFHIRELYLKEVLQINSCLFKLLAYLYFNEKNDKVAIKQIYDDAKSMQNTDMDRNWLYIYEVLNQDDLINDWKDLKNKKVSFLRQEFQY